MRTHVAVIDHGYGTNLYADLTEASLDAQFAAFCRQNWKQDGPPIPPPEAAREVIDA